jgi:hypothetical protein
MQISESRAKEMSHDLYLISKLKELPPELSRRALGWSEYLVKRVVESD